MKIVAANSLPRRFAGIMLIECIVYIAVFAVLTSVGLAAFYLCWDQSKAFVYATDDISAALRVGERWRADVRDATGRISVEHSASGEILQIPAHGGRITYRFQSGEIYRDAEASHQSLLLLPKVNSSQMTQENRNGVTAWRWELDVVVRRPETHLPLLFTFEAAQGKP
jgi:hypothetical protein